jgi:DNA-binding transcriptional LysR family regulator
MIRHLVRVLVLAVSLGGALGGPLAGPALGQSTDGATDGATDRPSALPAPEQAAIRQVIEGQLAAFQHDDGAAAFGYATPMIQQKFGDAATFMSMVKSGYGAVYRPRSVAFDALRDTEFGPDQVLQLIGPDGLSYTAHYIMQKQPDGRWMINGCYLTRGTDQSV